MNDSQKPATLAEIKVLLEETLDRKLEEKLDKKLGEQNLKFEARFDEIYDALQEVITLLERDSTQKVGELRDELEPRVTRLEHKVFAT